MTGRRNGPGPADTTNPVALPSPHRPGILIADDMGLILTLLKIELEARGCAVWLAVDGEQAIDLYRRHQDEIDLVLLDVQMPRVDGPHALAVIQSLNPTVLACFMTGSLGEYTEAELLDRGAIWVLEKPFHPAEAAQFLQLLVRVPHFPTGVDLPASICEWESPEKLLAGRAPGGPVS